jgi:hypothetical protein
MDIRKGSVYQLDVGFVRTVYVRNREGEEENGKRTSIRSSKLEGGLNWSLSRQNSSSSTPKWKTETRRKSSSGT